MENKDKLAKLTLEEKASLLVGNKNMETKSFPSIDLKPLILSDGPNGIRKEQAQEGAFSAISKTLPATCFPSDNMLASSWNASLLHEVGVALGKEAKFYDVNVLLGPAINIQRNPLCGRNFEYYSEDPLLAGEMASAYINGVQSENVYSCVKHFACNNNEKWRFVGDSLVDERALHEIYLKPFEIAVKKSHPGMIMTSYNKVNGTHMSENKELLNNTLRKQWGFTGATVSDWGGVVSRDQALDAGQDLEMPGMVQYNIDSIVNAVKEGRLEESKVDESCLRLMDMVSKTKDNVKPEESIFQDHKELSLKAAIEGAVLLKNNDNLLPLNNLEFPLFVGDLFMHMRYQGSGSSMLNPHELCSIKEAFNIHNMPYEYARGYDIESEKINHQLEKYALEKAAGCSIIVFFAGQNDEMESEGYDRDSMHLPENQLSLLNKLILLGKRIIVVLYGGSPVMLPFLSSIDSLLYMGLPGQQGGEALYRLLYGLDNPSGRLTQTWPLSYLDVPFGGEFTSTPIERYKESFFVGYRYYETMKVNVNFPFGFGLSYGRVEYSHYHLEAKEKAIHVQFDIENKSDREMKEVAQIYASINASRITRPSKVLVGFQKVSLQPNEIKHVEIEIPLERFEVYDKKEHRFVLEGGNYTLYLSKNVARVIDSDMISIHGVESPLEDDSYLRKTGFISRNDEEFDQFLGIEHKEYVPAQKKKYTLETPLIEMKSFWGKKFCKIASNLGKKQHDKALKMPQSPEREREMKAGTFIYKMMPYNCLRSMSNSSGGTLTHEMALSILDICNGKLTKGINKIRKELKRLKKEGQI